MEWRAVGAVADNGKGSGRISGRNFAIARCGLDFRKRL
jgi:hypothetical protein